MTLLMIASVLAGCTSGDPDGDDTSGIDMEILNQMIDDNLQDFINNTTIVVNNHYHNNTTVVNNYDETNNDFSYTTNVEGSFGGVSGFNGSGGHGLYLLDIQFNLSSLLPEQVEIDYRNNTVNYEYTYYDYFTNSERTDTFTIQCSDYYLIGSQSENSSFEVSYWQDSDNYWDAWVDQYNQTIANMLEAAAYAYIWIENDDDDYYLRAACDENYTQDEDFDNLLLFEITIPEGTAIRGLDETNYGDANEQYVWGYEIYDSHNEGDGSYTHIGNGDREWRTNYYPDSNTHWSRDAFSNQFEYDTISFSYSNLNWVGGEEETTLSVYVSNIYPDYEYRLIVYFEMAPVLSIE